MYVFINIISFLLCSTIEKVLEIPFFCMIIHSTFFYDRSTMNIKRPDPIQIVFSFIPTKQLTKPSKREDKKNEAFNCNTIFTEFNSSI